MDDWLVPEYPSGTYACLLYWNYALPFRSRTTATKRVTVEYLSTESSGDGKRTSTTHYASMVGRCVLICDGPGCKPDTDTTVLMPCGGGCAATTPKAQQWEYQVDATQARRPDPRATHPSTARTSAAV